MELTDKHAGYRLAFRGNLTGQWTTESEEKAQRKNCPRLGTKIDTKCEQAALYPVHRQSRRQVILYGISHYLLEFYSL